MSDVATIGERDAYAVAPAPSLAPAESSGAVSPNCLNCTAPLTGAYCAVCGQRAAAGRLTMAAIAREFVSQVIELDHGLLHTIVDVAKHPGTVIRGIFEGRRRSYTGPAAYVTLAAAASLLLDESFPKFHAARAAIGAPSATAKATFTAKQLELLMTMQTAMSANKLVFLAVLIPPLMLLLRFFFRKQGVNLAEAGVFICYAFGTATFIVLPLSLPFALTANATGDVALVLVVNLAFVSYAALGVFGRSFSTAWRIVATLALGELLIGMVPVLIAVVLGR